MPENNWLLNDSTPTTLAGEFSAEAPGWTGEYWGPAQLAFNGAQSGAVYHDASVGFAATGSAIFGAQRVAPAAVSDTGVGILGVAGQRVQAAIVAFVGTGTAAFNAVRTLVASISFSAAGTFNAIATKVSGASVADAGAGAFDAQGERIQTGAVAETGAGAFAGAAEGVLGASVSFAGSASFAAAATHVHSASVSFGGAADLDVGSEPVPLLPNEVGGYGFDRQRDIDRRPRRRRQVHEAAVAFRGEAHFAARAHLIPGIADIPLPFLEEPEEIELPVFAPAIVGRIRPSVPEWTDEEMLVALLMLDEAA